MAFAPNNRSLSSPTNSEKPGLVRSPTGEVVAVGPTFRFSALEKAAASVNVHSSSTMHSSSSTAINASRQIRSTSGTKSYGFTGDTVRSIEGTASEVFGMGSTSRKRMETTESRNPLQNYFASLVEIAKYTWVPLGEANAFLQTGAAAAVKLIYDAVGAVGPPVRPETGSLFIVDERRLPNWRDDGYEYVGSKLADGFAAGQPSQSLVFTQPSTTALGLSLPPKMQLLVLEWDTVVAYGPCKIPAPIGPPPKDLQRRALRLPRLDNSTGSPGLSGKTTDIGYIWLVQYLQDEQPPNYSYNGDIVRAPRTHGPPLEAVAPWLDEEVNEESSAPYEGGQSLEPSPARIKSGVITAAQEAYSTTPLIRSAPSTPPSGSRRYAYDERGALIHEDDSSDDASPSRRHSMHAEAHGDIEVKAAALLVDETAKPQEQAAPQVQILTDDQRLYANIRKSHLQAIHTGSNWMEDVRYPDERTSHTASIHTQASLPARAATKQTEQSIQHAGDFPTNIPSRSVNLLEGESSRRSSNASQTHSAAEFESDGAHREKSILHSVEGTQPSYADFSSNAGSSNLLLQRVSAKSAAQPFHRTEQALEAARVTLQQAEEYRPSKHMESYTAPPAERVSPPKHQAVTSDALRIPTQPTATHPFNTATQPSTTATHPSTAMHASSTAMEPPQTAHNAAGRKDKGRLDMEHAAHMAVPEPAMDKRRVFQTHHVGGISVESAHPAPVPPPAATTSSSSRQTAQISAPQAKLASQPPLPPSKQQKGRSSDNNNSKKKNKEVDSRHGTAHHRRRLPASPSSSSSSAASDDYSSSSDSYTTSTSSRSSTSASSRGRRDRRSSKRSRKADKSSNKQTAKLLKIVAAALTAKVAQQDSKQSRGSALADSDTVAKLMQLQQQQQQQSASMVTAAFSALQKIVDARETTTRHRREETADMHTRQAMPATAAAATHLSFGSFAVAPSLQAEANMLLAAPHSYARRHVMMPAAQPTFRLVGARHANSHGSTNSSMVMTTTEGGIHNASTLTRETAFAAPLHHHHPYYPHDNVYNEEGNDDDEHAHSSNSNNNHKPMHRHHDETATHRPRYNNINPYGPASSAPATPPHGGVDVANNSGSNDTNNNNDCNNTDAAELFRARWTQLQSHQQQTSASPTSPSHTHGAKQTPTTTPSSPTSSRNDRAMTTTTTTSMHASPPIQAASYTDKKHPSSSSSIAGGLTIHGGEGCTLGTANNASANANGANGAGDNTRFRVFASPGFLRAWAALLRGWRVRCLFRTRRAVTMATAVLDTVKLLAETGSSEEDDKFAASLRAQLSLQVSELFAYFGNGDTYEVMLNLSNALKPLLKKSKNACALPPGQQPPWRQKQQEASSAGGGGGGVVAAEARAAARKSRLKGGALGRAVIEKYSKVNKVEGEADGESLPELDTGADKGKGSSAAAVAEKPWLKTRDKSIAAAKADDSADTVVVAEPKGNGSKPPRPSVAPPRASVARTLGEDLPPFGRWRLVVEILGAKQLPAAPVNPHVLGQGPGMKASIDDPSSFTTADPEARVTVVTAVLEAQNAPGEKLKPVSRRQKTKTSSPSLNPTFGDVFVFPLPLSYTVEGHMLYEPWSWSTVCLSCEISDTDRFAKEPDIGVCKVRFPEISEEIRDKWAPLASKNPGERARGQLGVKFRFVPPDSAMYEEEIRRKEEMEESATSSVAQPPEAKEEDKVPLSKRASFRGGDETAGMDAATKKAYLRKRSYTPKPQRLDWSKVKAKTVSKLDDHLLRQPKQGQGKPVVKVMKAAELVHHHMDHDDFDTYMAAASSPVAKPERGRTGQMPALRTYTHLADVNQILAAAAHSVASGIPPPGQIHSRKPNVQHEHYEDTVPETMSHALSRAEDVYPSALRRNTDYSLGVESLTQAAIRAAQQDREFEAAASRFTEQLHRRIGMLERDK